MQLTNEAWKNYIPIKMLQNVFEMLQKFFFCQNLQPINYWHCCILLIYAMVQNEGKTSLLWSEPAQ